MATLTRFDTSEGLRTALSVEALRLGFDALRIAPATLPESTSNDFDAFIAGGYHGDMNWMADTAERRRHPQALWPQARSVIVLAINYGPAADPLPLLEHSDRGFVSVYARGRDYHDVLKTRLKALARWLVATAGGDVKVFVDTAPLLEKPLAAAAGLGWQGKHTNLVSRTHGSWLFLGEILTTLDLPPDVPETDHCGTCRKCLDICPTQAFLESNKIDARRCISYLTIEYKGHIAHDLRPLMGNRIYGCDDCLAICPWNKFAEEAQANILKTRVELEAPHLADLAALSDAEFRKVFAGSPVKRIGRARFVRNVLIAIGNSERPELAVVVEPLCFDESPLVRAMAAWALSRIAPERALSMKADVVSGESDDDVREEWAII